MYQYRIGSNLTPLSGKPDPDTCVLTLLSSEELDQNLQLPGLEQVLRHTPTARDARVCKAEPHRNYLCGTIVTPRHTKEKAPIAFGYPAVIGISVLVVLICLWVMKKKKFW